MCGSATSKRSESATRKSGPFAETREQLGGYTIIEANDLDEAISIASGFVTVDTKAAIEVRPIVDLGG